jgi:hypothetical protein
MGNVILRCFKGEHDYTPPPAQPYRHSFQAPIQAWDSFQAPIRLDIPSRPQLRPSATVGFTNLTVDIINYELNSVVPFLFSSQFFLYYA